MVARALAPRFSSAAHDKRRPHRFQKTNAQRRGKQPSGSKHERWIELGTSLGMSKPPRTVVVVPRSEATTVGQSDFPESCYLGSTKGPALPFALQQGKEFHCRAS